MVNPEAFSTVRRGGSDVYCVAKFSLIGYKGQPSEG